MTMLFFKCGFIVFGATFILSVFSQIVQQSNILDTGLAILYLASSAIAGKIIYDRYQQIHILSALTPNPNVTSFANRIASLSAFFLSLGFLIYFFLFLFKVDNYCLTALGIFICGTATLYMWMQCIVTTYASTLFYNKNLMVLRQFLANVSFLIVVILAVFGIASTILPKGGSRAIYFCLFVTSLCSYTLTAIFCVFIVSFGKDYKYFAEDLLSEMMIDDACSVGTEISDMDSLFGIQDFNTNSILIKNSLSCAKIS